MSNSQNDSNPRTWFITGGSSGIGLSLVRAAAERGDNVTAVARNVDALAPLVDGYSGRVHADTADVTDRASIERVVADSVDAFGRIDVVVNNAGHLLTGAVEEATDEQVHALVDVSLHGRLNVLRATLPTLRAQRSGHVIQTGSYLGHTSGPGLGLISATKFAIEGLSEALATELAPLGIKVTILEPGLTATGFFANATFADPIDDYDQTVREARKKMGSLPPEAFTSPDRIAEVVLKVVDSENPPLRLPTGAMAMQGIKTALTARLEQLDAVARLSTSVDSSVEVQR